MEQDEDIGWRVIFGRCITVAVSLRRRLLCVNSDEGNEAGVWSSGIER
jgi:hypothetical protein